VREYSVSDMVVTDQHNYLIGRSPRVMGFRVSYKGWFGKPQTKIYATLDDVAKFLNSKWFKKVNTNYLSQTYKKQLEDLLE
jgi:hypothetical protein